MTAVGELRTRCCSRNIGSHGGWTEPLQSGRFRGEEEVNFAAFHTDASDGGHDVSMANERMDLVLEELGQAGPNKVTCGPFGIPTVNQGA